MAKRTRTKRSKKKYTLTEFRAWLEGVEELQPSNWSPDAEQWKLIREKIDSIVEPEPEVVYEADPAPTYTPAGAPPPSHFEQPDAPPAPVAPLPPSAFTPADVQMTPEAQAALTGQMPKQLVPDASGKLKTPDIDTMDGQYNSGFE